MPMGIVSSNIFDEDLNKLKKPSQQVDIPSVEDTIIPEVPVDIDESIIEEQLKTAGRGNVAEFPDSARALIGEAALVSPANEVARAFGVSPSSVTAYKVGAHSTATYNRRNTDILNNIEKTRNRIVKKASNRLIDALNHLKDLKGIKPRDAAGIARDMSVVLKNMTTDSNPDAALNAQFVFFTPPQKQESDYSAIRVDE